MAYRESRIERRLLKQLAKASATYDLIAAGDRIMVGVSGGKDSYALLYLLRQIQKRAPFQFEMIAVNLDQGHPGFPAHIIEDYLSSEGFEYKMLKQDTFSVVMEKIPEGKTYCSLCSRLRRGVLYKEAVELGCNKIALGHHRDDSIETLLLNLFYAGQIKAMPPRLTSDDGRNVVIRPLIFSSEDDLAAFAKERQFPIIPCDLCGSQDTLYRQRIKRLLDELSEDNDHVRANMLSALQRVVPSHLLDLELRARCESDELQQNDSFLDRLGGGGCGL